MSKRTILLLSSLCLLSSFSVSAETLRFDPQVAAQQKQQANARDCFLALGIAHNAAFLTSLAATFPADLVADFTAHVANLTLKACPPELEAPADVDISIAPGQCGFQRSQNRFSDVHANIFGVPVPRDSNWGQLGSPRTFHWNTDVEVVGSHPFETDPTTGRLILPVGESQVIWDAFSMISVMDNLFIYVPGLPKGLVKKLGPRGLKVAEVLLDVAVETGLVAATQAVDSFITPLPSGAVNRQVQRVIVRDIEPPIFENITRSSFVFEAVEPGGTSFDSLDFSGRPNGEILREAFTVRDPCDRPVQLIPDAGFWPLGGPSIHRWIAVDPGPNALGLSNETILTQTITVQDTLEPVILAPDDIVVESGTGSALLNPGQPQVFDLGDVDPAISNDGLPADGQGRISFPLGVNELRWTAEDSSGNTASATQIVNVKLPGANRPPQAQPTTLNARTFEFSEVTLDATDPDLDPLSYRIADWPEHGFFSAPLYPYFIEDFRLPLGTACTPNRDPELVEKPEFVQTTDTGITYVLNRELVNPCTSPPFGGRISVFDSDGNFLLGRDMPPSADLNGLQLDTGRNEILYTAFDRSTFQPQLFVLDGTDLSTRRLYTTAGMASGFDSALIDDQEILYVSTGTSEIEIYDLREAIQDSGVQFTLPPAAGTLDVCHPDQALCSNSTFASRDLALTSDGALIVSTERRIHRFDPLDRDASGAIVFPGEARWLGACVSGEGCDPERQASRGFSCVSDGTCLSDFDAPRDGPGQLDGVFGLAVDPNGIIYAADRNNRRVQRFTPEGSYAGQARNECPAGQRCFVLGDFGSPQSISVNARQLLVVDSDLDLVHSFETSVIDPQEDGTAQVRYRSVEGFQGSDSFSFIATDGLDDSPPATVAVTVARNFRPPVAAEDTVSRGPEDTAIPVTLFASDPDGSLDTLTYEIVEPPALGSLSGSGRDRIYTPPLNFEGEQSFSFRVFDGREFSETVEHIIVVEPVNDPPVLELVSVGVAESRGSTPQVTVPLGYPAEFRLRYEDPDAIDQYTVSVEWGGLEATQPEDTDASDGSIDGPVLVDQQSGSGEILALYTYQRVGTRTANFCLTDNIMLIDGVKTPTESSLTSCLPVSVTADPMADVQVQILAPPVVTARQESVTVEFQVHNRQPDLGGGIVGGLDATNLRLEASLSGAGTFESFITQPAASCSDSPTRRDCSLDDLAPGETVILRQIVDINPDAGSLLALDVEVWTDTVDPRLPNRQTLDIPIGPDADILVTQEADESTACQLLCDGPGPCEANGLVPECSLRSALALANSRTGTQRILLGDGVFELDRDGSDGAWTVSDDLQLLGLGAGRTRVSGAGTDRVIRMENPASLVLEDLSVVNGLIDSSGGGGILTTSDGDLILRRVQVQGNASSGGGGGILNFRGRLELWDSTVSGNESSGNSGGGIFSGGPTRIVNSTVSGNFAAGEGGGILIDRSGSLSLESSTITANSTGPAPPTSIRQSTGLRVLTENIFDNPTTIYQSVISGNGSLGDGVPDCDLPFSDAVNSLGFNYVEESCLGTLGTGDQTGETPQLSGLGDQGGPTPTHLPLTGSPLLDAGDPQCDGTDQRGITRPQDGDGDGNARCDIGAVEFQLPWIFSDRFERRD